MRMMTTMMRRRKTMTMMMRMMKMTKIKSVANMNIIMICWLWYPLANRIQKKWLEYE